VQGLLAGLSYWALGVPFPVFLALLTALAAFLPLGGTALVWAPAAVYLFAVGAPLRGVLQLAWGIGVVTMVDNVLKPLLIGGQARIPTLLLFFGILGGLKAFGFLGAFLGPAVMALALTCLDLTRELLGPAPPKD
jgi:predicted PurR-regulated permease PerM